MIKTILECDTCTKQIKEKEDYIMLQFKKKGALGIRKRTRFICKGCIQKSETLKKAESLDTNHPIR